MRTLMRRLAGLVAVVAIAGILAGVPWLLVTIGANPVPDELPGWAQIRTVLSTPDDGTAVLWVLQVAAWAGWAFLAISLLVEIAYQIRDIPAPQLPGLALPQGAARGLVTLAAGLFVALPGMANAEAVEPVVMTHQAVAVMHAQPTDTAGTTQTAAPAPATATHTVKPGETLWSIAEQHLGDGARYPEIVDLNGELLAESGSGWLRQGWALHVPAPPPPPAAQDTTHTDDQPGQGEVDHQVRAGDTLWDLAEEHLGDGARYPEIYQASQDTVQPGGAHLSDPDMIGVGWTLTIPDQPASTNETSAVEPNPDREAQPAPAGGADAPVRVQSEVADPGAAPQIAQDALSTGQDTGTAAEQPTDQPEQPTDQPEPAPSAVAGTTTVDTTVADTTVVVDPEDEVFPVRTTMGVGSLLAAGVIGLLSVRRRSQHWHRRPGRAIPMPAGATAATEQQLRATADPMSVQAVDAALRALARQCATTGSDLPVVRAGRLTASEFELYLAERATPPAPWTSSMQDAVWTLTAADVDQIDRHGLDDVPAPYPALVTVGHDTEDGHVFLDLEHLGTLGVTGNTAAAAEVLAAIAIELATSCWADHLQITVVGAYPDLEDALGTGRIRYLPAVGRLLEELQTRADQDRQVLTEQGAGHLQRARVTGQAPDAWAPEVVLLAGQVTAYQRQQLQDLIEQTPRVAVAAVTTAATIGQWALRLSAEDPDQAVLDPVGLQLRPQRIDAATYDQILDMITQADPDSPALTEDTETEETTGADVDLVPVAHLTQPAPTVVEEEHDLDPAAAQPETDTAPEEPAMEAPPAATPELESNTGPDPEPSEEGQDTEDDDATAAAAEQAPGPAAVVVEPLPRPAPLVKVLGGVEIDHATDKVEKTKRARLLEYAAYLALNPGATATQIDEAIWPGKRSESNLNTRNTATSKLRSWLGKDADGQDYLPRHQHGSTGYALAEAVTTDWHQWRALLPAGPLQATTEALAEALELVRGRPFEGVSARRYAWSERACQQMITEITDACYELGRRRLMSGKWRGAEQAVVIGLWIEPAYERLWRLRIMAAHASGNHTAQDEAIDRMLVIAEQLGGDLEDETTALLVGLKDPASSLDELIVGAAL